MLNGGGLFPMEMPQQLVGWQIVRGTGSLDSRSVVMLRTRTTDNQESMVRVTHSMLRDQLRRERGETSAASSEVDGEEGGEEEESLGEEETSGDMEGSGEEERSSGEEETSGDKEGSGGDDEERSS